VISYTSGDCISGTIDIDLQADIVCQALTVVFIGIERAHLSLEGVIQLLPFHRDVKEICRLVNVVVEFPTN